MQQYQTAGPGEPLVLVESETPAPVGSQILMKTRACGVCHSDVHLHDGAFNLGGDRMLPVGEPGMTLGHEIMGEVVALGPEATDVAVGDRRVVYPWVGCGDCSTCARGDEHLCLAPQVLGIQNGGGFGDHVLVPDSRYLFDFGDADPALAATYACSGLTAYSALKRVGDLAADDQVVILGAGGLGQMAMQIGQAAFGLTPIVVDIDDARLEAARAAGASAVFNSGEEGAAKALKKATGGGAFAVLDFVGSEASANFALDSLRKGGKLIVVGLYGGQLTFPLPFFPMMARVIEGNYVGSLQDMAELMALVRQGQVEPIRIERRPAADAGKILGELKQGQVQGRAVLVYD